MWLKAKFRWNLLKVQTCTFPFQLSAEIVSENNQEKRNLSICKLKLKCREASGCSLSWEWTERDSMLWKMTGNKFKETHQNHCNNLLKKQKKPQKKTKKHYKEKKKRFYRRRKTSKVGGKYWNLKKADSLNGHRYHSTVRTVFTGLCRHMIVRETD